MKKSESGNKYALVAAICYAVYAIYNIINTSVYVLNLPYYTITPQNVLFWIAMIGMAIALFMKNQKIAVVASGVNTLLAVYGMICSFSVMELCDFLAYASVAVFAVLSLQGNALVKELWSIPAVALLFGNVINWITNSYFDFIYIPWRALLASVVEIVALLFTVMWIKAIVVSTQTTAVNEYATFDPQVVRSCTVSSSAFGGADKLMMYKELLESGAITQEEFEKEKREVLEH